MDVAERLRLDELRALSSAVRDENIQHAQKQLNERGRAQELVRQQYSGRYPFELLQNANDAAKELGLDEGRRAYFLLTETALIVADDGAGFHDDQIRSICSLGASSKGPSTAIGHKGLGFKSVGEITARPQIISNGGRFQFDGDRVRNDVEGILGSLPESQSFPVYAFPFPLADDDLGDDAKDVQWLLDDGYVTVIRLPFAEGVKRATVAGNLHEHLIPNLLLFLPSIGQLELHGTVDDFVATVLHEQVGAAWNTLLEVNGQIEQWLIYRHQFAPAIGLLEPLGEGWTDVEAIHASVAVPLDDSGQPKTNSAYPLSVYFPTEERAGLRVMIHAEWVLTLDRKHVSDTPEATPLNQAILHEVADFVRDTFAVDLVEHFGFSREAVHGLLPTLKTTVTPGAGEQLRELWIEALARSAFIPAVGGESRSPRELRMLPGNISSSEAAHQHAQLDQTTTIRPDLESVKALRQLIGDLAPGAEMTLAEYAALLREPEADALARYYGFLLSCRQSAGDAFTMALKTVPCVLTSHSGWVAPSERTVFLPRARSEAAIPEDIPVPIAVVPENVRGLDKFLEDLGVKTFQWRTIIESFLIVVLRDPEADADARTHALNSLRAYHEQRRGEEVPEVLTDVLLPARSTDDSLHTLQRSGDLYFPRAWTGSTDLEILYGPFGKAEFLNIEPPTDPDELADLRNFYEMLGVVGRPRIQSETRPGGLYFEGPSHPHYDPFFSEWLAQPETNAAAHGCPSGHPASQRLKESHRLDRLTNILDSSDPARMRALWRQLAEHWDAYKPAMRAVFRCVATGNHESRERTSPSLLAYALTSRAWVPVVRGGEGEVVSPSNAWYEAPDTPRKIRVHIPRVEDGLLGVSGMTLARALGLTDAARPSIDDLLTLLARLAQDADEAGEVSTELAYAARWVQRRLNDRLHPGVLPHPNPAHVRLLARHSGVKKFVPCPAHADDPLLRTAWEGLEPILISDSQPRGLANHFSLTDLDKAVETVPQPAGIHHSGSEANLAISSHIERRKPHILALISVENQSVEDSAQSRLRTLELIVCEELELRYVRGDTEIPRPDAPCYIKTRSERQGRTTRVIGTAYLRLLEDAKSHRPDWHAFAAQLAEFLDVPSLSDAIAMLLTASPENRRSMLAQHSVEQADVDAARQQLQLPELDDDELQTLAALLPTEATLETAAATLTNAASSTVTVPAPTPGDRPTPTLAGNSAERISTPAPSLAPPPVDYSKVQMFDAHPGAVATSPSMPIGGTRPGGGFSSPPSMQSEQLKRDVGARGEEIVYRAECARLETLGLSPDLVDWVSKRDALSPYDMTSVENGQQIYIEVKATTGSDPTDPFQISRGELVQAAIHRERFYIYRVTDTYVEAPTITRFPDPFGLVTEKKGEIMLSKASMTLTNEPENQSTGVADEGID